MDSRKDQEEKILVYPKNVKIPGKKKSAIFGSLLLLILSSFILWACNMMLEDREVPETPVETGVETPVSEDEDKEENITYLTPSKDTSMGKYEFRAAWLPSVRNLEYPEKPGMDTQALKDSFRKILDVYELYHLNAVIMQVRPAGDALYISALNPPSIYVTGDLTLPLPYDLLEYAVSETHKRGMEFHAWFNPFRVTVDKSEAPTDEILSMLHDDHYARNHPDKVLRFDNRLFLDPGDPDVHEFVINSIMEVVRKYDIDAVHLDDYFYPYRTTRVDENGETVPYFFGDDEEDKETFETHKGSYTDIKEWRRNNTYTFVKNLSTSIHDLKPYVKLGISPFGIWGHAEETDGRGSDTPVSSSETYNHSVFIDTRKWIEDEIIDYILPQIYWNFGESAAPYSVLAKWWDSAVEGTRVDLYIGHANYKVYEQNANPIWQGDTIISDQIAFNHTLKNIRGSAFFSFRHLTPNHQEFTGEGKESLVRNNEAIKEVYDNIAIVPASAALQEAKVSAPKNVVLKSNVLSFSDGYEGFDESEKTRYFIIYQFPKNDLNPENRNYIHKKIAVNRSSGSYKLNHLDTENYTYGVSAFNRLHFESNVAVPEPKQ